MGVEIPNEELSINPQRIERHWYHFRSLRAALLRFRRSLDPDHQTRTIYQPGEVPGYVKRGDCGELARLMQSTLDNIVLVGEDGMDTNNPYYTGGSKLVVKPNIELLDWIVRMPTMK